MGDAHNSNLCEGERGGKKPISHFAPRGERVDSWVWSRLLCWAHSDSDSRNPNFFPGGNMRTKNCHIIEKCKKNPILLC